MIRSVSVIVSISISSVAIGQPTTLPIIASDMRANPVDPWAMKKGVCFLLVRQPTSSSPSTDADALWQREIRTQATMLASYSLIAELAKASEELHQTQWWKQFDSADKATIWLMEHLDVRVIDGTSLIGLALNGEMSESDRKVIEIQIGNFYLTKQQEMAEALLNQESINLNNKKDRLRIKQRELATEIEETLTQKELTQVQLRRLEYRKVEEASLRDGLKSIQVRLDEINDLTSSQRTITVSWKILPQ